MDKLKFVLLIEKGIEIPESLRTFLRDYLIVYAESDDCIIETNSVAVLAYTEELHGNPAKVRLVNDFNAALRYYFGYEEGCELMVLSEKPIEEIIVYQHKEDIFYAAYNLRPYLADFPYTEPVAEFPARSTENSKASLKVYKVYAHKNPHLHYFKGE